jgi:hypothetical protein
MQAATRHAKSRTKRRKPAAAADPWQALPRLADLFDRDTPQPFFKGSKIPELEELALTETQLLEQTAALLGASLAQLVKAGTLVYAKREFLNHKKYSGGDSETLLRSGSGVAGVADARIQAAYESLATAKVPVTPSKLASRALTGYPTALRWLKIHHPELLVPTQEAPKPDTVPSKEVPQTTTHAKPAQKQPEATTKRKRGTAKANATKLPKRLRNPKNHPELLAGNLQAKTAQKQPDTHPRDHDTAKAQKPARRLRSPENEPF